MSDTDISADEQGVVRVYAIRLPPEEAKRFARPGPDWPLKRALGAQRLEPAKVEAFDVADLAGLGLTGYLTAGFGVDEAALAPDAERLDAVRGWVAVLPSSAFGGQAQTLDPGQPLEFLGAWPEVRARPAQGTLTAESAKGRLAPAPEPPAPSGRGRAGSLAIIVAVAVVIAALLLVLLAAG